MKITLMASQPEHSKLSQLFRALVGKPARVSAQVSRRISTTVDGELQKRVDSDFAKLTRP